MRKKGKGLYSASFTGAAKTGRGGMLLARRKKKNYQHSTCGK